MKFKLLDKVMNQYLNSLEIFSNKSVGNKQFNLKTSVSFSPEIMKIGKPKDIQFILAINESYEPIEFLNKLFGEFYNGNVVIHGDNKITMLLGDIDFLEAKDKKNIYTVNAIITIV